jgi:uncharacterized membrane protein
MPRRSPSQRVLRCLGRINALLAEHFPAAADNPRELPDDPVVCKGPGKR